MPGEVFVCAGVELMTRVPIGGYNPLPSPRLMAEYRQAYDSMGVTAENVARGYQITREAQQEFAVASHRKAAAAREQGHFAAEIVPIRRNGEVIDQDGCIRPETSQAGLAEPQARVRRERHGDRRHLLAAHRRRRRGAGLHRGLRPASTAWACWRASGASRSRAAPPRSWASARSRRPARRSRAPGSRSATSRWSSSTRPSPRRRSPACATSAIDPETLNLDGGALALGHPLGATGARITGKTASLMQREGRRYGLATQCIGGGQGIATVLEAV